MYMLCIKNQKFFLLFIFIILHKHPVFPIAYCDDESVQIETTVMSIEPVAQEIKPTVFDYQSAIDDIRVDELRNHLAWLADKEQEGRAAGSIAGHRAGDYLADRLKELKLQPAGNNGGYWQGLAYSEGQPGFCNVLGIIPGSDPVLKNEYILLCAHYDHVGIYNGEVYPGANDNASGTSMVLELAESLQKIKPQPKRSIIIVFWDAEEIGLIGSGYFVQHPTIPLQQIKFAINFDMVGGLKNNCFEIFGVNVAQGTREYITRLLGDDDPFVTFADEYILASDHAMLYSKKIPVIMFFTGLDCPYHVPEDTIDMINFDGMKQIADIAYRLTYQVANEDDLSFIKYNPPSIVRKEKKLLEEIPHSKQWSVFECFFISDHEKNQDHAKQIFTVPPCSIADQCGIKSNDILITFNGRDIPNQEIFDERMCEAILLESDRPVKLRVARPNDQNPPDDGNVSEVTIEIDQQKLTPIRNQILSGFLYRESIAEPGTLIVVKTINLVDWHVPLQPRDRIFRINGKQANKTVLDQALQQREPITLDIEHLGRLETITMSTPIWEPSLPE